MSYLWPGNVLVSLRYFCSAKLLDYRVVSWLVDEPPSGGLL
jgi:hypothetical protein